MKCTECKSYADCLANHYSCQDAIQITNADRIRAMSDERLAVLLASASKEDCGGLYLTKEWLAWLEEPAEGEQHGV